MDFRKFHQLISESYSRCLYESPVDYLPTLAPFTDVIVHPMTGNNTDDCISAMLDLRSLPTLPDIADAFKDTLDIWDAVQVIARDRLTSRSGFHSFYNPDMTSMKDTPVYEWEEPYIECLIQAMTQAIAIEHLYGTNTDDDWHHAIYNYEIEWFYMERLQTENGVEEKIWEALTDEQADELNKLIPEE